MVSTLAGSDPVNADLQLSPNKIMCSPTSKRPEPAVPVGPCFHLEAHALARLESLAKAKGVSTTVALHQLLEAGTRHLSSNPQLRLKPGSASATGDSV